MREGETHDQMRDRIWQRRHDEGHHSVNKHPGSCPTCRDEVDDDRT